MGEITHYEDQLFNKKKCFKKKTRHGNNNILSDYFDSDDEYVKLLADNIDKYPLPYLDIDSSLNGIEWWNECNYYCDLTSVLRRRWETVKKNNNILFIEPGRKKEENDENKYKDKYEKSINGNPKIAVYSDANKINPMLLTSDQFGFSAGYDNKKKRCALTDTRYPYGMYYNLIKDSDNEEKRFIAQCVYDTRTIGGAFLWPVMMSWENDKWEGERDSNYNMVRGRLSYIEDRVDLTLLEIKHMLSFDPSEYSHDILYGEYIKKESHMKEWFEVFDGFNEYVDLLMFNPFVVENNNEYSPIDIINSEIKEKQKGKGFNLKGESIETLNDCKDETGWGIKNLYNKKDMEGLKRMLENVRLLTLARSRMMEMVINNGGNPWEEETIPQWKMINNEWIFEIQDLSSES